MANVTIGAVEFDVNADGSGFERQVRRIARTAGRVGGHELATSFGSQAAKDLSREEGVLRRAFRSISARWDGIFKSNQGVRSLSESWKSLSHNTRQWTLIIGAVLAGMQHLAVLSSAAAGGLFILGGAVTGSLVGLGALFVAFQGLGGEIDKLPESVRPAAKAFQDLTTPLKELRDFLTERAFAGMEGTFRSLGNTIRRLIPAFGPLADVIRGIVSDLAAWAESEEGIRLLTGLIENSAPILRRVADLAGKLGRALLLAFDNPKFQKAIDDMFQGIDGLFSSFERWVQSDDFGQWIEDTQFILGKFGDLLGATSQMLQDLVTPEAISRTGKFLDNLTKFMPHLGDLLDFLGRLDPFGLLAESLATIGDILEPIAGPLGDIADGLNRIIGIAIDEWGDKLKGVFETLEPFFQSIGDFLKEVPESTIRAFADALLLLAGALLAVKAVKIIGAVSGLSAFFGALKKGNGIVGAFNLTKLGKIAKGLASFAAITAIELIPEDYWDSLDLDSNAPKDILTGAAWGSMFGAWGAVIGAGIATIINLFTNFEGTMNDIGWGLIGILTGTTLLNAITEFFANLIPDEWLGSDNPLQRFLWGVKFVVTETGTAITQLPQAFSIVWQTIQNILTDMWNGFLTTLSSITAWWDTFWSGVHNVASSWFTLTGNFISAKLDEIGANWNLFWSQLGLIVQGTWNYITSLVKFALITIETSIKTGLRGAANAWNSFWGSIPNAVSAAVGRVAGLVSQLLALVRSAMGGVNSLSRSAGGALSRAASAGGGVSGAFASGGVLNGPRRILAGESGPEAIVPLKRALGSVDPSVRWLSAIAQGKTPAMAGVPGGGTTNNVEAGAIVINEARDPLATGVEVLDRLVQNLV